MWKNCVFFSVSISIAAISVGSGAAVTPDAIDNRFADLLVKVKEHKHCTKVFVCDYFAPATSCSAPPCCKKGHWERSCEEHKSDIRLKRDIVQVARLDNGIRLYRFRYKEGDQVYVGVMAQDVALIVPDAVVQGPDGYLRVDYGRLGLHLMTWDDWVASGGVNGLKQASVAANSKVLEFRPARRFGQRGPDSLQPIHSYL